MNAAIGMEYVKSFAEEVPPIVQDPYTTDNPTNLTASISSKTLTIASRDIGITATTRRSDCALGWFFVLTGLVLSLVYIWAFGKHEND